MQLIIKTNKTKIMISTQEIYTIGFFFWMAGMMIGIGLGIAIQKSKESKVSKDN
jgi:hypothetical protein